MKKLQVFLSSAMNGELNIERELIKFLFNNDHILTEFYELFAIEDHSSPNKIEDAFCSEVANSDIVVFVFRAQLRDAVLKEYNTAREKNRLVFIYLANSDKKEEKLNDFISTEIFKYDPGFYSQPQELCNKIKNDLLRDLLNIYTKEIHLLPEKENSIYTKKSTLTPQSIYRFFSIDRLLNISKELECDNLSIDQLISLSALFIDYNANYKIALALLELALIREPSNWILHNNRGLILETIGLTNAALFSYNKVIELDKTNDTAYYNLGGIYFSLANYEAAINNYKKALDLNPHKGNAIAQLSACYLKLEDKVESLNWAKKAFDLNKDEAAIVNLISAFVLNSNFEDAMKFLNLLNNTTVIYKNILSYILYKQNKYSESLDMINELFDSGFMDIEIAERKFYILIHLKMESDSFEWFKEIEKTFPITAYDYNNLGYKYIDILGKSKFANYFFRKAVSIDKNLLPAWQNLQFNLVSMGEFELCIDTCDEVLKIFPYDKGSMGNKTTALVELGRFNELFEFNLEKMMSVVGNSYDEEKIKDIIEESFKNAGVAKDLFNDLLRNFYELNKIKNKSGV